MTLAIDRPRTTLVCGTTIDGKITDTSRVAASFGSAADREHLLQEIAAADVVVMGAGTLRAYRETWLVAEPELSKRRSAAMSEQPTVVVWSHSLGFSLSWRFFQQPVERWLMTTPEVRPDDPRVEGFERVINIPPGEGGIDVSRALAALGDAGFSRAVVLAGGQLNGSLLFADCVDEIALTISPTAIGGSTAPTLVDGRGLALTCPRSFMLSSIREQDGDVFLRYLIRR